MISLIISLLLPFLFFFFFNIFVRHNKVKNTSRPPGPPRLPLIGNLLQFGSTNRHIYLHNLSKTYGPLMSLQLGCRQAVVISSAKMAKEALKTHDLVFSSRPSMMSQQKLSYNGRDVAFSAYNSYWREMRKICIIHLLNQKRVQSFYPLIEEEIFRSMKKISMLECEQQVDINSIAMSLASTIICRVAFGKRYDDDDDDGNNEKERFKEVVENSQAMLGGFFFHDYFPSLGFVDKLNGMVSRLEITFKKLDLFFQELIEEHLDPNRPQMMKEDMINLLIQLKEDQGLKFDITWDNIKAIIMVYIYIFSYSLNLL